MDNVFEQVEKNIDNLVLGNADWTASATKEELEAARKGELHLRFWDGEVPAKAQLWVHVKKESAASVENAAFFIGGEAGI